MTHLTVWSLAIFRYWITNGAQHAKHCVVFAQLHSEGQNHGIHGVLVRIRDDSLKTMPGVTVEDMGYKMGLNGVDNAKLSFDNVRVPTRTGKPGKMGRHFPVREKSGNFEQTGKVREKSGKITQNTGKLREFGINIIKIF